MPDWTGERLSSYFRTIVQTFFIEVQLLILDTKDCQDLHLVDFIVRLALARTMWRFSILAKVGDVFTFRVPFLLLRMEFMHSSLSQTGSRFFDRGLLLEIVLLAILVRMSMKCSIGSSKSLGQFLPRSEEAFEEKLVQLGLASFQVPFVTGGAAV